ncbi:hypothetical protein [Acinetobacter sp.]|uniref:hypothetical protein n=1 Tax=Acinetobacter sp. TaxID=472 RepID=UPI0028B150ED|nr:hypothetical protein [Acinetobacter sp.]
MWIQIALFVASLVISYALQPKPTQPKAATANDFDLPKTDDGTPKVVVFGDVWLTSWCVIGSGNYRNKAIYQKQKGLLGSKKVKTGYKYLMSLHMGVAIALDDLVEIKVSDKTAWSGTISSANQSSISINKPNLFGGDEAEGGIVGKLTIMRGAADQPALPELQAMLGAVPAYRGCVTFFYDGQICSNSPYPKPWSFRVRRTTSGWDGAVWYPEKATIWLKDNTIKAMNPAHIIYEAQTNRAWGRGFSSSQIDIASFKAVADQLFSEGFGLCLAWRRQDNIHAFIQEVLDHIGAAMQVDRLTGLWRLDLIRDNYDVSTLPSFNFNTGLLRVEEDNNSSNDLVTNQTIISYVDPITNETRPARAENLAAIQRHGIILENKTYTGIPTVELAGRIAARDMKIAQSGLKRFKVVLDRRAYTLQPASVFKLELPERGIGSIVVRAVRVAHDSVTNGEITVTAVQDVFGLPATNFIQDQPSLWEPPNFDPKPVANQYLYEIPFAELLSEFTVNELKSMTDQGYVGVIAEQPTLLQLDFTILGKTQSETAFEDLGIGDFSFISSISNVIAQTANTVECNLVEPISNINIGDRAFINAEIVRIDEINYLTNTLTLARGCIDTVPMVHDEGSQIMVYSDVSNVADRLFNSNSQLKFKLITHTSQGDLGQSLAPELNMTMNKRMQRPYPPANVKINESYYPAEISGDLALSWSHRNRLLQTDRTPSFIDVAASAEENTTYNLRIFDASNTKIFEKLDLNVTNLTWPIPRIFDGEMETVLDIPMTGANGSAAFADNSANHFPVMNNFNTLIKTDTDATGGSSAFFDAAILQTVNEYQKLDIYSEDHCIEFRLKTAVAGDYLNDQPNIIYMHIQHDRHPSENISIDYLISAQPYDDKLIIEVVGQRLIGSTESETTVITFTAENLSPDSYYDIAIQCTEAGTEIIGGTEITQGLIKIFVEGIERHSGTLDILSQGYPCGLRLNLSPNIHHGSKVALNGLRITKRNGGRYNANYTPQPFMTGSNDPYWSNVVLLLPMTGIDGGHTFNDVSTNPAAFTASDMVVTKPDIQANGDSVAYFNRPALVVESQEILNLKDKSFIIEGRVKCHEGVIFNITDSMILSFNQYQVILSNYELPQAQTVVLSLTAGIDADWRPDRYFTFKVTRDAASGKVTLMFDNKSTSDIFNPSFNATPDLVLCPNVGVFTPTASFNGFKLYTADATATLVPNVENPLRVELESKRDGLLNHQSFSTTVTVK